MGGPMLPDTVTQTVTQVVHKSAERSIDAGFPVFRLCSVLCDHPELDGGRGRHVESLPTFLAMPSHTYLFIKVLCDVVLRIGAGLRGGVRHTCVLHNSRVIQSAPSEPGISGASGLMPDPASHGVRCHLLNVRAGSGTLRRAPSAPWNRTRCHKHVMTNPVPFGEVSPPCLGLSGGPWWPINIPPPADAGRGTR